MRAFVLQPGAGNGGVPSPVGGQLVFKLRGAQSNGAMTVLETVAASGEGPPLHFHQLQDEWLYVLEGEIRFRLGDDIVPAPAVHPPRRRAHLAERGQRAGRPPRNDGAVRARALLRAIRRAYCQAANPDTFRALPPEAGLTIVGPPLAQSHPTRRATNS